MATNSELRNPDSFIYRDAADQLEYVRQFVDAKIRNEDVNDGMSAEAGAYIKNLTDLARKFKQDLITQQQFLDGLGIIPGSQHLSARGRH